MGIDIPPAAIEFAGPWDGLFSCDMGDPRSYHIDKVIRVPYYTLRYEGGSIRRERDLFRRFLADLVILRNSCKSTLPKLFWRRAPKYDAGYKCLTARLAIPDADWTVILGTVEIRSTVNQGTICATGPNVIAGVPLV